MKARPLGDVISESGGLIQTGPFGSQLHQHDYTKKGIPVVMPRDIVGGAVDWTSVARIPERKASTLSRHRLKVGDIVFPRRGDISKCALIRSDQNGALCGTGCLKIEVPKGQLDALFFYYYLRTPTAVGWLERNAVGSTMLNLSASIVARLPVPVIDVGKQQRIAEILSTYDDLIENNQRRIKLLEAAARLLYKEWFVRFRFPGHEHVHIVNGVPEAWQKTKVGNCVQFLSRGITPTYDDEAPGLVINQRCIRNGRLDLSVARRQSKAVPENKIVRRGDVLINSTGAGTLGRVANVSTDIQDCTVDSHVTIVRPSAAVGVQYFGMSLKLLEGYISSLGRGATNQTELSRESIAELPLLLPRPSLVKQYETLVECIESEIATLSAQNAKLQESRDLLLPRLMSGEVEV